MSNKYKVLLIYFVVWSLLVSSFWIFSINDSMGYSLVTFYIVLPIMIFVLSVFIGKESNKLRYIVPFIFGFMYMLAEYLTFSLANMILFNKVNVPEFRLFFIGIVISFMGMLLTWLKKHI